MGVHYAGRLPGTLYIVATPIGNLEDITHRALRVLREAAVIACEDTRQTRKLLEHYGIATPLISFHEHNESERTPELILRLKAGQAVALVADAGTPLISDPGYRLVSAAREAGLAVVPVPGPSAVTAALSASGLPTDSFRFGGYLPPRSSARQAELKRAAADSATLVYFESPHRILDSLADIAAILGERPVVLARELSKVHEEFLRGTAASLRAELARRPRIRGEFTVLIGRERKPAAAAVDSSCLAQFLEAAQAAGVPRKEALKQAARYFQVGKRRIYRCFTAGAAAADPAAGDSNAG